MGRGSGVVAVLVALVAADAAAQACSSCTPLALPSGVAGGLDASARGRGWLLVGQLNGGWISFPGQSALGQRYEDPNRPRVDLGLITVQASAQHRSGFGFDVMLPMAVLQASDLFATRRDPGLGDLEVRARFAGSPLDTLTLTASLGAAAPTGRYAPRSGALALSESASALTPGRGALWALAEGEARWSPAPRFTGALSLGTRVPLTDAPDGFRWAPEVRGFADAQAHLLPRRWSAGAGLELQWRGVSSVIDPFLSERVPSTNTGGVSLVAVPSTTVQLPQGFFASASVRIPLFQQLEGLQFVQGIGVFAGLGWAIPLGDDRAAVQREAARGQWAVLKYDAKWCVACRALAPKFEQARARRSAVKFEVVDVTDWSQEELEAAAPGASALPIVELRRPDGSVAARLEGNDAFTFEEKLEEALR